MIPFRAELMMIRFDELLILMNAASSYNVTFALEQVLSQI